ncbi:unnamed protein product [Allacma fusca]|uniref:Secreted protein n=1 Tax=Allacma fusca TaxID=39272 RepID=A0A8J2LVF3_9HEXA|nr:unnamed protein product [Allacma fusca]
MHVISLLYISFSSSALQYQTQQRYTKDTTSALLRVEPRNTEALSSTSTSFANIFLDLWTSQMCENITAKKEKEEI